MRLPSWLTFSRPTRPRAPSSRTRRSRPCLELLEDRCVPAAYSAANVTELVYAINDANLHGGDNTITLTAATFTLTAANNPVDGGNGLPVIAMGDNLTIAGSGNTIERSTAAGTPAFRLFDVAAGASLTLINLTLQGGRIEGNWAQGGAVYNQGELDLDRVTVQNNVAQGFLSQGGGIWSNGALTLEDNTLVQNNQALGGPGTNAWVEERLTRPRLIVAHPAGGGGAAEGGGLFAAGGTVTLADVTFSSNTAQGGKGGDGAKDYGVTLSGADGGEGLGGGLAVEGATVCNLVNCTVANNTAKGGAGGKSGGKSGPGYGGGLHIAPSAAVYLDSFTLAQIRGNHASTGDPDISGSYATL